MVSRGLSLCSEEFAAANENVFLPRQFSNTANSDAHYSTTGPEIWAHLEQAGLTADAFVAGVERAARSWAADGTCVERQPLITVHPSGARRITRRYLPDIRWVVIPYRVYRTNLYRRSVALMN